MVMHKDASDSERVVRTFRETHAISAMASSTTGCEQKRSETMTVRGFAVSGLKDRADKTRKA